MKIHINEAELTISVLDTLSFEADVLPIYKDVVQAAKDGLDADIERLSLDAVDVRRIRSFINHQLTDIDKVEILAIVREEFEFALEHYPGYGVSIFDPVMLQVAVNNWAKDKFYIDHIPGE